MSFSLRTSRGIKTSDKEICLIEPTFVDVDDSLNPNSENLDGDNVKTDLATLAGDGLTRWGNRFTFSLLSHAEQYEFFKHMEHWHGMARPVWVPSWRSDFIVLTNISPVYGNRVKVLPDGFDFVYQDSRYGLLVHSAEDVLDVFQIAGYDPNQGDLILSHAIDVTIPKNTIRRCSLIRRARSASDRFDWDFLSPEAAQVGVSFTEVFNEGAFV